MKSSGYERMLTVVCCRCNLNVSKTQHSYHFLEIAINCSVEQLKINRFVSTLVKLFDESIPFLFAHEIFGFIGRKIPRLRVAHFP